MQTLRGPRCRLTVPMTFLPGLFRGLFQGLLSGLLLVALLAPRSVEAQVMTGAVEGRIFDADTGEPLQGFGVSVEVGLFRGGLQAQPARSTSDAEGRYRIEGLEAGSHRFYVYRPGGGYIGQIYSQISCPFPGASYGSSCDDLLSSFAGDSVTVVAGETVTGIDFPMVLGGEITGVVTDAATGEPIVGRVGLFAEFSGFSVGLASAFSTAEGRYRFRALPGGNYELAVFDAAGHVDSGFTQVAVTLGEVTVLDVPLQPNTTLSGRVSEAGSGDPVAQGSVQIFDLIGDFVGAAPTAADGTYEFGHLEDGTYYLWTKVGFDRPWVDQFYGGIDCAFYQPCDVTDGAPVVITGGTSVTDIDFSLVVGGSIAGTILTGTRPDLKVVSAYSSTGSFLYQTSSDPQDGSYQVQGLAEGTYYLVALGLDEPPILYEDLPCGPDNFNLTCDPTTGTAIPVVLGQSTPGIDFTFLVSSPGDCVPSAASLCLNQGRFEVKMTWETPLSVFGQAAAVELLTAGDSGYFYFFSPDNVEVVVKVLDACDSAFNSFWVFAAGLTNLRVEMVVTDTVSGEVRTYTNPLQTPFQPILDTRAFRTCDAVAPAAVRTEPQETRWPGLKSRDEPLLATATASQESQALRLLSSLPGLGEEGCVPDGLTLCLQGGRFRVEAEYRTADGGSSGVSEPLTDDTGVFFFFSRDNAELVVKVLSNCAGPSNHYWVFAAGLTNVEVTLRVTDTVTGAVKTYVNPLGESYLPILDTRAFDTCDGI